MLHCSRLALGGQSQPLQRAVCFLICKMWIIGSPGMQVTSAWCSAQAIAHSQCSVSKLEPCPITIMTIMFIITWWTSDQPGLPEPGPPPSVTLWSLGCPHVGMPPQISQHESLRNLTRNQRIVLAPTFLPACWATLEKSFPFFHSLIPPE